MIGAKAKGLSHLETPNRMLGGRKMKLLRKFEPLGSLPETVVFCQEWYLRLWQQVRSAELGSKLLDQALLVPKKIQGSQRQSYLVRPCLECRLELRARL